MTKIDIHTHSTFSFDGVDTLKSMIKTAYKKGIAYYGIAEHFNADYLDSVNKLIAKTDIVNYLRCAKKLQKKYKGKMTILAGCEFGFAPSPSAYEQYQKILDTYAPDFVINSVHSVGGIDYAWLRKVLKKEDACKTYLETVRQSLDAPYHYDIVAHIEYVLRYVDDMDASLFFETYEEQIRDILQTIIDKDKILEVNTSSYGLAQDTLPDERVLTLYYTLGGRKISFGSDAHAVNRVGDKWDTVATMLKKIGFAYLTVPCRGEHIEIAL